MCAIGKDWTRCLVLQKYRMYCTIHKVRTSYLPDVGWCLMGLSLDHRLRKAEGMT